MNTSQICRGAAVAAAVLWAAKAAAIGLAGGLGRSPAEGPLFLLGFLGWAVAIVTAGLALSRGRSRVVRVLAVLGTVASAVVLTLLLGAVIEAMQPEQPGWVWGEVNLWVLAIATMLVAFGVVRTPSRRLPLYSGPTRRLGLRSEPGRSQERRHDDMSPLKTTGVPSVGPPERTPPNAIETSVSVERRAGTT